MTCPQTDSWMSDHLLGEVLGATAQDHIADCDSCRQAYEAMNAVEQQIQAVSAPDDLAESIMAKIQAQPRPNSARSLKATAQTSPPNTRPSSRLRQAAWGRRMAMAAGILLLAAASTAGLVKTVVQSSKPPEDSKQTPDWSLHAKLQCLAPNSLRVGDRARLELVVLWPHKISDKQNLKLSLSGSLQARSHWPTQIQLEPGRKLRIPIEVEAVAPGTGGLHGQLGPARLRVDWTIEPSLERVEWAHVAVLDQHRPMADINLRPDSLKLLEPRAITVELIPGPLADSQWAMGEILRRPKGCFEQQYSSLVPNLVVLDMAQQQGAVPASRVQEAEDNIRRGLPRLERFQGSRGSFSLHSRTRARVYLSILGVDLYARLVERSLADEKLLEHALSGLLDWQDTTGEFFAERSERYRLSPLARTALATRALIRAGAPSLAVQKSLNWLVSELRSNDFSKFDDYDLAVAARTLLADTSHMGAVEALATALLKRAQRHQHGHHWRPGRRRLLGSGAHSRRIETTAIVAQVLGELGQNEGASKAISWILKNRHPKRGFGDSQASLEVLGAYQHCQHIVNVASGELQIDLLGEPDADPLVSIDLSEDSLRSLRLDQADSDEARRQLFQRIVTKGLRLRHRGQGLMTVRVVVSGLAPDSSKRWRSSELRDQSRVLKVSILRPRSVVKGQVQLWRIKAKNVGSKLILSPIFELALPSGFRINDPNELDALVDDGQIFDFEQLSDRLIFYLPHLDPGQFVSFPLRLVADSEGVFQSGWARVHPASQNGTLAQLPSVTLTVHAQASKPAEQAQPQLESSSSKKAQALSRQGSDGEDPEESEDEAPDLSAEALRKGFVVAWDPALGPLDLDYSQLPYSTKALEQLLVRALLRGLPAASRVTTVERDRIWDFEIKANQTWSNGDPVLVDDFIRSWDIARGLLDSGDLSPRFGQEVFDTLKNMEVIAYSSTQLRIVLATENSNFLSLLARAPFLPQPKQMADKAATNGAYTVAEATPERWVLLRRKGPKDESKMVTIRVEALDEDGKSALAEGEKRADIYWSLRSKGLIFDTLGVSLHGVAQRSGAATLLQRVIAKKRSAIAAEVDWLDAYSLDDQGVPSRLDSEILQQASALPLIEVAYAHKNLRPFAEGLADQLWDAGFTLFLHNLALSPGDSRNGLEIKRSGTIALGALRAHLSTLRGKAKLDANGALSYPPQLLFKAPVRKN